MTREELRKQKRIEYYKQKEKAFIKVTEPSQLKKLKAIYDEAIRGGYCG